MAYAADRETIPPVGYLCQDPRIEAVMSVLTDISEEFVTEGWEGGFVKHDLEVYGNFSTAYLPLPD